MGFLSSASKFLKLRKISKALDESPMRDGDFSVESMFAGSERRDKALEQLLDLCESDQNIRTVMDTHHADRQTLRELYHALLAAGAGQWASAHYVPASTIAYPFALEYGLRSLGWGQPMRVTRYEGQPAPPSRVDLREVAYRVIMYFERGEVGPIA